MEKSKALKLNVFGKVKYKYFLFEVLYIYFKWMIRY